MATSGSWDLGRLLALSEARNAHAEAHGMNGFATPPFAASATGEDFVVAAETLTQTELQRDWGGALQRARRGEHVVITSHGRRDVVIINADEYADLVRDTEEMRKPRS